MAKYGSILFIKKNCNNVKSTLYHSVQSIVEVSNCEIRSFSLCFLYASVLYFTFSRIVTFMSDTLCPGRLKWYPVALFVCLLFTQPLCCVNLVLKLCSVSPMYLSLHLSFWHSIKQQIFELSQLTFPVMCHVLFFILIFFPSLTNGQSPQKGLPHFFIPGCLLVWFLEGLDNLALTSLSLKFSGLLQAIIGGSGKTSARQESMFLMALQCFCVMFVMFGNLGSNETTNFGLVMDIFAWATCLIALALGMALAFSIGKSVEI